MRQHSRVEEWSVDVGIATKNRITDGVADELLGVLNELGALGAAVGFNDEIVSARFDVEASNPSDAAGSAESLMQKAAAKVGMTAGRVEYVHVDTLKRFERELMRPAESYLGVHEIAEMLNVSKQRVSELRRVEGFPAPIAELAAGPVWTRSNLQRFVDTWSRKPGRPRKQVLPIN